MSETCTLCGDQLLKFEEERGTCFNCDVQVHEAATYIADRDPRVQKRRARQMWTFLVLATLASILLGLLSGEP